MFAAEGPAKHEPRDRQREAGEHDRREPERYAEDQLDRERDSQGYDSGHVGSPREPHELSPRPEPAHTLEQAAARDEHDGVRGSETEQRADGHSGSRPSKTPSLSFQTTSSSLARRERSHS